MSEFYVFHRAAATRMTQDDLNRKRLHEMRQLERVDSTNLTQLVSAYQGKKSEQARL